jgi:hypothetical protein
VSPTASGLELRLSNIVVRARRFAGGCGRYQSLLSVHVLSHLRFLSPVTASGTVSPSTLKTGERDGAMKVKASRPDVSAFYTDFFFYNLIRRI